MERILPQDMPRHEDQPRTRVSILGNNGKDCTSTDSRIYFGGISSVHNPPYRPIITRKASMLRAEPLVLGSAKGYSRARIGILGNNEKDCATADFRVLEQEDMLTALIHVVMML